MQLLGHNDKNEVKHYLGEDNWNKVTWFLWSCDALSTSVSITWHWWHHQWQHFVCYVKMIETITWLLWSGACIDIIHSTMAFVSSRWSKQDATWLFCHLTLLALASAAYDTYKQMLLGLWYHCIFWPVNSESVLQYFDTSWSYNLCMFWIIKWLEVKSEKWLNPLTPNTLYHYKLLPFDLLSSIALCHAHWVFKSLMCHVAHRVFLNPWSYLGKCSGNFMQ